MYLSIGVVIFLLVYYAGTSIQLSGEQADNIKRELVQRNKALTAFAIFANNVAPSLEMFIPGAGVGIGIYSAYSTGQAFSAFALSNPALRAISPLSVFISPFAIMEIFAYGLAISRSGMIVYYLVTERRRLKQTWKKYFIPAIIEVAIVIVILFVGSLIEWQILLERQHAQMK